MASIGRKAMDAEYLRTHIGGGWHRLYDGGHSLVGSWKAVSEALMTACGAGLPCGEALGAECSEIPAVQPVAAIVKHARTAAPARLRRRVMSL